MQRDSCPLVLSAFLAMCPLAVPSFAQNAVSEAGSRQAATAAAATSLEQALHHLPWDPARRGPLLVVAPTYRRVARPFPQPQGRSATALRAVAEAFGCKVVPLPTVTALAPKEMIAVSTRPQKADPLAGLRPDQRLLFLMASLDAGQWRRLGGPSGLGLGDLAPEQKALFLSILPQEIHLHRMRVITNPDRPSQQGYEVIEGKNIKVEDRSGVRLRLSRSVEPGFPAPGRPERPQTAGTVTLREPDDEFYAMRHNLGGEPGEDGTAYGAPLWRRVPSRLKPSQIAFDDPSLAVTVPLGGEAATVGELVRRISAATGLEIHTDLRLRALPVWVRGERARAGDLLAALCWSMTGAIRRLGDAYLLTADVEGLGARYGRLAEWAEQARLEQGEQIQKLTERIAKQRPLAYLQPAPADDALALPAGVASRIEEGWATRRDSNGPSVAVADLPPALQKAVRAQAAWWSGGGVAIDPARAFLRMRTKTFLMVPGVGAVDATDSIDLQRSVLDLSELAAPRSAPASAPQLPIATATTPDAVVPPALGTGVLLVAPKDHQETERAVAVARTWGAGALWVEVPRDAPDAAQRLAAAVAAGKAVGLPVWGAVRLLRERDAPPARQERNILGETPEAFVARQQQNPLVQRHPILGALAAKYGGWALPDPPTLTRSLVALARVPGLAGLVLRDTAAPGYPEQVNDESRLFLNGEYGFIPEQRLAFLRKEGVDPIDIVTETYGLKASIPLPFLRDDLSRDRYVEVNGSPQKDPSFTPLPVRWNAFLTAANVALLEDLRAALRATRPDLPVLMDDRMSSYRDPNVGWFGSWDQPGLPPVNRAFASEEDALKLARSRSKRVLRSKTFAGIALSLSQGRTAAPDSVRADAFARAVARALARAEQGHWDGLVLDLSEIPVDQGLPLLEQVTPRPSIGGR